MDFNINDFFLLEADDEAKKEEDEKKDDEKKESESKEDKKEENDKSSDEDDSEYNDLMDDDNADSELSDDTDTDSDSSDDTDSDSSDDDEYNDLMDDDIGDLSVDDDEPVADDDSSDDGGDYNTLIVVKEPDGSESSSGDVFEKLAKYAYASQVVANNFSHIATNACGPNYDTINQICGTLSDRLNWGVRDILSTASESPLVKIDNLTRAKEHVEDIEVEDKDSYDISLACERINNNLTILIKYAKDAADAAGNRTDIQRKVDDDISYFSKEMNGRIRKIMTTPSSAIDDCGGCEEVEPAMESYNILF